MSIPLSRNAFQISRSTCERTFATPSFASLIQNLICRSMDESPNPMRRQRGAGYLRTRGILAAASAQTIMAFSTSVS